MIARIKKYISCLEKYPLYATLIVLDEYEKKELYEECAIIRDAITEYKYNNEENLPKGDIFPTSLSAYNSQEYREFMIKNDIIVKDSYAKEKAKMIKIKVPLDEL